MPADRPYSTAFASARASSIPSTAVTVTTGANSSSRVSRWPRGRPVTTVGATKCPGPSGIVALVTVLGLHRQRGDRAGLQALDADRFAGFLAITVGTVIDPVQCSINFGDQLALAVPGAKLDGPVGLR